MTSRERRWKLAVVAGSLLALTVVHFTTSPHWHALHEFLFKVTFLPLLLAGLWFHVRGGLIASLLTSAVYLVHLFTQLAGAGHHSMQAAVGDIFLYNVVAFTTGFLASRHAQELQRAETQARELEQNARALLQAEETIRGSERLRALGELAAGMAHEIRNPLGGIRGAAEVLRKPDTRADAREEFGALLDGEVARLDRVVGNFLDFARPPAPETSPVRPAEVLDSVFLLLGAEARRHEIALESTVPRELSVRADPDLLRQVLLNLSLNAVQVQQGRGGGRVRVTAARDGDLVALDVEDRGPGVAESIRDRLFDPYVTARAGGSGLGLPIAARLADSMGGRVMLRSTGPDGTVFRVTLPLAV